MHIQSAWSIRIPGISRNLSQHEVDAISNKGKQVFFFALGCAVVGAEVALRFTTNVVSDAGEALADVHTAYVTKVRSNETLVKSLQTVEPRTVGFKQEAL
jgi:hypothetical protein